MDKSIENILCCVGLSSDSHVVLEQALRLASATGARLHILHAVKSLDDDVMNTLRVNIRDKQTLQGLLRKRLDDAQQQLDAKLENFFSALGESGDVVASCVASRDVIEGYPAKVIVHRASKLSCDLIVMASNKRGFTAAYAGKVTRGVLKRSQVPVVVVPPPE
ncbi:universal stress protein [Halomonas daqingensis]|uniref:Universal stress protein n=1 Tax=Billgrantia desiderata TaxID=52021 RepID=A0ABS9B787_9GAMM|nr:universal stress protein [Halomonas desiderata]MCE8043504.1 universal stress protein [Halomonas desiderata]MCE8048078.1 universal stress protein [Halomonas desiderata]